jgi:hypothetical protein
VSRSDVTKILILATCLIWIIWDIYVYSTAGNPATESATLIRWFHQYPGFTFLFGVLIGHTVYNLREPIDWTKDETQK